MPGICRTCKHPDRIALETELLSGVALRSIVARYKGTSMGGLSRHVRQGHILAKLVKAAGMKEMIEANDLAGQARLIQEQVARVLAYASQPVDPDDPKKGMLNPTLALRASREARDGLHLMGEVAGKLRTPGSPTIINQNTVGVVTRYEIPSNGREATPERLVAVQAAQRGVSRETPANGKPANGKATS